MKIVYHKRFRKHFKKRILPHTALVSKFEERLKLFLTDYTHPLLNDHQLTGEKQEYRSFSVAGDIRVVYKKEDNILRLYDIGSHNQVY